jgi:hypothetical protein
MQMKAIQDIYRVRPAAVYDMPSQPRHLQSSLSCRAYTVVACSVLSKILSGGFASPPFPPSGSRKLGNYFQHVLANVAGC